MTLSLVSPLFRFHFHFPHGTWEVVPEKEPFPSLVSMPIALHWRTAGRRRIRAGIGEGLGEVSRDVIMTPIGSAESLTISWETGNPALETSLEWRVLKDAPFLLWRVQIANPSDDPVYLDQVDLLKCGPMGDSRRNPLKPLGDEAANPSMVSASGIRFPLDEQTLAAYVNGWQSWNYAGTLSRKETLPQTRLGFLTVPMRFNSSSPKPKKPGDLISEMFALLGDRKARVGLLVGNLSQRNAFCTLRIRLHESESSLSMWACLDGLRLDPGASFYTDWSCLQLVDLDSEDPLGPYLDLVGRYSSAQANAAAPVGWCSWYHAFQRVDEDLILANLTQAKEAAAQFPLDIIQVDDGYQRRLGDWFETGANFPRGMPKLRKEISEGGFTAGIWLAPFVANWRSHLVRAHPDWILRNRLNIPVNPGFIFDSLNYPLDITHPGVRAYVRNIVGQVTQAWGYEYLKLDFLYAGALSGVHYDPTVTRAQALFHALQDIRHAAGEEVFLLGCGGPLGSGIGIFDAMRINPDVSPRWNPSYWGIEKFLHSEEGHPSTRNAILTTINRLPLHRRWWVNDPDCLLLRSEDTHLTPAQVQTLATVIALSAGSLIISDDLGKLSQERRQWLSRLIPPLPDAARALDWFDTRRPGKLCLRLNGPLGSWVLFARINWRDEPVDCVLDLDEIDLGASFYHGVDFWREEYLSFQEPNTLGKIPPHGVRLFAMREEAEGAQWLGDTLHISQGLEVKSWEVKEEGIAVELEPGHHVRGSVWLKMPWVPQSAELDGQLVTWKRVGDRIYKFELTARRKSKFAVRKH